MCNKSTSYHWKFYFWYICFSKSTAYNTLPFEKLFWISWKVLDTIVLWQDVGPCCEQTHAAFEVGLSLNQGQGVYSGWSDVDGSSQLRLCHTCIIDVMLPVRAKYGASVVSSKSDLCAATVIAALYVLYCILTTPIWLTIILMKSFLTI